MHTPTPPEEAPEPPVGAETEEDAEEELPADLEVERTIDFRPLEDGVKFPEGSQWSPEALESVKAFITFQVANPTILSGEWQAQKPKQYWGELLPHVGEELTNDLLAMRAREPLDVHQMHSVAAFFSPGDVGVLPECSPSRALTVHATLQSCLAKNIRISDVEVASSNLGRDIVVLSFTVRTSRLLTHDSHTGGGSEYATSTIKYVNKLWVDLSEDSKTGRIVALQNRFSFGPVVTYEYEHQRPAQAP